MEDEARAHAEAAQAGHQHATAGSEGLTWRERVTSQAASSDVAHNFRGDTTMLWKEITAGFVIAGFVALLPAGFFNGLFLTDAPDGVQLAWNVVVGPLVAVLSFVCSVGNVPLAAVLWAGGISFAGVIAFIYADLIVIPILLVYGRVYGWRLSRRLVGIMFATMVVAALAVDAVFGAAGLVPPERPSIDSVAARGIEWNYTAVLNVLFAVVAAALVWPTLHRGARDPVCGMTVDRFKARHRAVHEGREYIFCGAGCKVKFEADSARYLDAAHRPAGHAHAHH